MNLLADEGVDRPIVEQLRQEGHHVLYIAEMSPGIANDVILAQANSSRALLLTLDKDFGELVFRQGLIYAGLLPATKAQVVAMVLRERSIELLSSFSVITLGSVRIRKRKINGGN